MSDDNNKPAGLKAWLPPTNSEELDIFWGVDRASSYQERQSPICECGGEKTYGPDTPFHSSWCPKYQKP